MKALSLRIAYEQNRIYGLDILRAFAILTVVITHSVTYLPKAITGFISNTYLDGVTMFFVLSGFLIGRILIKSLGKENLDFYVLMNFWWRRWLRTLPIYFLILSLVVLGHNYPDFNAPSYKRFFIFSQNFFTQHPAFFIEAWSLSVEEWFYLLIPFLTFILVKYFKINVFTSIIYTSILVILLSTGVRLERYLTDYPITELKFAMLFRMQVITRLDSLMYGVLGALFAYFNFQKWTANKVAKLIVGIAILIVNKIISFYGQHEAVMFYYSVFYFSLNSIGTLLLLPFLSTYVNGQGTIFKMVTYVSLISYSMYLINLTPIQNYIIPFINEHIIGKSLSPNGIMLIDLLIYFPITILGSIYLYKFVETPFMRYRDKVNFSVGNKTTPVKTI